MTTVARFSIDYVQYLDPNGKPTQKLPEFANDRALVTALYRQILLTRELDRKAVNLQRTGRMGTYPSALGQEATSVGMGHALAKDDVFVPYYRDQGAMIQHGVTPEEIFSYWGGDEHGNHFASHNQDFPISVPVASQLLHAVGVAYAFTLRQEKRAVLTTTGDGGTSEGDFYEALNFAGAHTLPVVFVINNNQWAISVPLSLQTRAQTLAQKAIAAGFEGIQVDGSDVIAVRDVVGNALAKARDGKGPTLIESINFRLCDHTTADDASRYVDKQFLAEASEKEPVKRTKHYLAQHFGWTEEDDKKLVAECQQEIETASKAYLQSPKRPAEDMFDYLFAELPQPLLTQRAELGE